ncbi:helix-turn-helix domain-containing protein [Streptomyces sp. AC536]|uniref:helix-turn-helix domain-containing protein n=1 Tax=Streptomyces buecherae TaxID=2763006 RepID=UPI00164D8D2B|nr:helix-turn-helix domain-containing protein [Streptomyces buecherae]MBC3981949.1 helix-turn-helix domain-containing protein [Streptomyces buecherae]QNJ41422.1 helix-turn-helix domain-containing protein [Streptomyces buecherae]
MSHTHHTHHTHRVLTFAEAFDLPTAVNLPTAARAFAVSPGTAYRLVRQGDFPCPVLRVGGQYRVPTTWLLRSLGIESLPVYAADIEAGATASALLTSTDAEREETL